MTRLYFHAATDSTSGLPSTEQSSLTAEIIGDALNVNRSMDTDIGVGATNVTMQDPPSDVEGVISYVTRFVSEPLDMTSISANTWTYNFATNDDGSAGEEWPIADTTNQPVRVNLYVWRPSTTSKIGTVLDGNTASTVDNNDGSPTFFVHHVTFSGASVSSMQTGDVLICEIWMPNIQIENGQTPPFNFRYDGTTENTTDNANVGTSPNHASFIDTPETLVFDTGEPPVVVEVKTITHINTVSNSPVKLTSTGGSQNIRVFGARMEDLIENFTRIMIRKWVHYLNPILARFRGKSFISPVDSIQLTQS